MNDFLNYDDSDIINEIKEQNPAVSNQFYYVSNYGHFPVYRCEGAKYYPTPNLSYKEQIEAVKKAKRFVFLEYLTIEDSVFFSELLGVLKACVLRGVEVRVIYDYFGSLAFWDKNFIKKMKVCGIDCRAFNGPGTPLAKFIMNRDHHKLMIVDNEIAFIGGYNVADEYFGVTRPYGQWQDTGFSFRKKAVKSMTVNFLYMWNMIEKTDSDISNYVFDNKDSGEEVSESEASEKEVSENNVEENFASDKDNSEAGISPEKMGYIQPYCGNPYQKEALVENVYLNLLKVASKFVYIITPYLIPDKVMRKELTLAAKRGVDVRIIIPGIPDKKWLYKATCSFLHELAENGVRIYVYTPGFCHGKQFLCDNEIAAIGSANIDGRAFKRDFENSVLIYKVPALKEMYDDFVRLFEVSEEVTEKYKSKEAAPSFVIKLLAKIFSPII